jgi:hypothetical protein
MALVVLVERCNFVSAGTETEGTGHFTLQTIYKGVLHLYYFSERRGLVVKKLDSQTYKWRFQSKRCPVSRNLSVKYILGRAIQVQGLGLRIFSVQITRPLLRFLDLTTHQEDPKLFSQYELRGLVDKTTAQQSKVQQFGTDRRPELGS